MHLPPQAYTKETLIQAYNWLRSQPPHIQELAKSPDALVALYSKAQLHGETYLSRSNLQGFKTELRNLAQVMGEPEEKFTSTTATMADSSAQGVGSPNSSGSVDLGLPPMGKAAAGASISQKGRNAQNTPNIPNTQSAQNQSQTHGVPNPHGNQILQSSQEIRSPLSEGPSLESFFETPVSEGSVSGSISAPMPALRKGHLPQNFPVASGVSDIPLSILNAMAPSASVADLKSVLDSRSWTMLQEVKNHFNLSSESEAVRLLIAMGYQKMRSQF